MIATGCIWQPDNRIEREKGATFTVSGFHVEPSAPIGLWMRNYDSGSRVSVGSATSGASETFTGSGLYPWSANITTAANNAVYWAPSDLGTLSTGTSSPGRMEFTATAADGTQFATFTAAARSCVYGEIAGPETYIDAGSECHDGQELIQFDNTGVASSTVDPTTMTVVYNGANNGSTRWDIVRYKSQGLDIYGVVCRPTAAGSYPVHMLNHGGGAGLFAADVTMCMDFAARGWITAMSAYRGEQALYPAYKSQGVVEVCLGEVTDVMRMLAAVQANYSTVAGRVLMTGFSHGGCVTTRAVQRGAPVQAAIDVYGPGDWAEVYNCTNSICPDVRTMMVTATGGVPAAEPRGYAWRSPGYHDAVSSLFTGDLAARKDVKFMIQHGEIDDVVSVGQSCRLAADAWGTASQRWHVRATGCPSDPTLQGCSITTGVFGCSQSWNAGARPHLSWPDNRYLMVYEGAGHDISSRPLRLDYYRFIDALGWATAFNWP